MYAVHFVDPLGILVSKENYENEWTFLLLTELPCGVQLHSSFSF